MELAKPEALGHIRIGQPRTKSSVWIWIPMVAFAFSCLLAVSSKTQTWHKNHDTDLDHLHFTELEGDNATCTSWEHSHAPCYRLLFSEAYHAVFWFDFFPLLVIWAAVWAYHPRLAFSECIRRWKAYPVILLMFWACQLMKRMLGLLPMAKFDASDHVFGSMVSLLITFLEVDYFAARYQKRPKDLVVIVAAFVWLMKAHLCFYTVMFFHTVEETYIGLVLGSIFTCVVLLLLDEWPPLSECYDIAPGTEGSSKASR